MASFHEMRRENEKSRKTFHRLSKNMGCDRILIKKQSLRPRQQILCHCSTETGTRRTANWIKNNKCFCLFFSSSANIMKCETEWNGVSSSFDWKLFAKSFLTSGSFMGCKKGNLWRVIYCLNCSLECNISPIIVAPFTTKTASTFTPSTVERNSETWEVETRATEQKKTEQSSR